MKEGIFKLTTTITNPKPDRRVKDQWLQAPEWPAGSRFAIRHAPWVEKEWSRQGETGAKAYELTCLDDRFSRSVTLVERDGRPHAVLGTFLDDACLALVAALAPSDEKDDPLLWAFIQRGDWSNVSRSARAALFRLVRDGVVTVAEVTAALDAEDADIDAAADAAEAGS